MAWRIDQAGRTCQMLSDQLSATPSADRNSNSLDSDEELDLSRRITASKDSGKGERQKIQT